MKGRHVLIDGDGKIVGGAVPKSAQGKHITNWWKQEKQTEEPGLSRYLREQEREHTLEPTSWTTHRGGGEFDTHQSHVITVGHGHQTHTVRNTTYRGTHEETRPGHLAVNAAPDGRWTFDSAFQDKDVLKRHGATWNAQGRYWETDKPEVLHRILADDREFPHVTISGKAVHRYDHGPSRPQPTPEPVRSNLPDLQGSPKQVAWAEKIRDQKLRAIHEEWAEWPKSDPAKRAKIEEVMAKVEQENTARWWIDHREEDLFGWVIRTAKRVAKGYLTTAYGEGRAPTKTPDAGKRLHQTAAIDATTSEESLPTIRLNGFTPNVIWALLRRAGYRLRITEGRAMLPGQTTVAVNRDGVTTLQGPKAAAYAAWFNTHLRDMVDWAGQIDGKQEVSSIRSHGGHFD